MQPPANLVLQVYKLLKGVVPVIMVEQRTGLELDSHTGDFGVLAQKVQPEGPMGIGICIEV